MRLASAVERDPAIDAGFESRAGKLGTIARPWFGYVNAFTAHVNGKKEAS